MCLRLTIKTPEQCHWCRSDDFIINSEHISDQFSSVSIADFEHVVVFYIHFQGFRGLVNFSKALR